MLVAQAYKMRANLLRKSIKSKSWIINTVDALATAVRKLIAPMPCPFWAEPASLLFIIVGEDASVDAVAELAIDIARADAASLNV